MYHIAPTALPVNLRQLTAKLLHQNAGASIYLVGGAVRDILLKRSTKDFDLVATGIAGPKLERWLKRHGQVVLVGKTFGVYKFIPQHWSLEEIDIALPRLDHSLKSGRYRDVKITTSSKLKIEDDLIRRDFTINALALNLDNFELIDVVGSQNDLTKKLIRTVGSPRLRFREDFSRLLRGLRFALQLNFKFESKTWSATKSLATKAVTAKLNNSWLIPREIIAREFLKSLTAQPMDAVKLWDKAGLIARLLPEVNAMKGVPQAKIWHSEGDVFKHSVMALNAFTSNQWQKFFPRQLPKLSVLLGILLHDIGKPLTLQTPTTHKVKHIATPEHDTKGAQLVPKIIARLKLTSYVAPDGDKIDADMVEWLVAKHLLLVHGQVANFKPSTLYKYFYQKADWGLALQQVIFADSWATRPADGHRLFDRLLALRKRLKNLQPLLSNKGDLKLLLNGNEVMKLLKLKPGPEVGKILKILTEAQLTKQITTKAEAKKLLQRLL
ncbi:TPA: hypothetical protein DIC39_03840 [Patescibacteria group bacterium]|nr:hypothetical protein [Patescibacteria group bacterium]HCU48155.1 hypothetical protein [Patescibacteria group bacterium]